MARINIANEIARALREYTSEVTEGLEEAKNEVAKETVKEVKKNVERAGFVKTGDYKRGWAKKKVGSAQVIHNRTDYQLTHLLERGHAKRGGGRVPGTAHIEPAERKAIEDYIERVERVIRG